MQTSGIYLLFFLIKGKRIQLNLELDLAHILDFTALLIV